MCPVTRASDAGTQSHRRPLPAPPVRRSTVTNENGSSSSSTAPTEPRLSSSPPSQTVVSGPNSQPVARRNTARPLPQPPKRGEHSSRSGQSNETAETAQKRGENASFGQHNETSRQSSSVSRENSSPAAKDGRALNAQLGMRGRELSKSYSTTDIITQALLSFLQIFSSQGIS